MQQKFQQLHNRQHQLQRHEEHLTHNHSACQLEPKCEDSKHFLTSTQIAHRYIPTPGPLPSQAVEKYLPGKFIEEKDPRVKSLPYETTTGLYHDRKIVERSPSEYYNLKNTLDPHCNPAVVKVLHEPERPFTNSEYTDNFKTNGENKVVDIDIPRPDQCLDNMKAILQDAGAQYLKDVEPASLDLMSDVTHSNAAISKLLHPYITVYDFDFEYPHPDSAFARYRRELQNNYVENIRYYSPILKKQTPTLAGTFEPPPYATPLQGQYMKWIQKYGNTSSYRPEQNLNNPNFGALQIVPKRFQHVPNYGLVSETHDMYVDPRKMLNLTHRQIVSYNE